MQDCNNCSCELGYLVGGKPFKKLRKYLAKEGIDMPVAKISMNEICTSCCVGMSLAAIRHDTADLNTIIQEYVYKGGCLILTYPNVPTKTKHINTLIEPFGLQIMKERRP